MRRPIRKKLGGYSRQIMWAKAKGWKRIFRLEQHFSNFNVHENPPPPHQDHVKMQILVWS